MPTITCMALVEMGKVSNGGNNFSGEWLHGLVACYRLMGLMGCEKGTRLIGESRLNVGCQIIDGIIRICDVGGYRSVGDEAGMRRSRDAKGLD
jgi:hypothetical protein